jgi:hypothetical protein
MVHRIDVHDRLIAFDDAFRNFAVANGAPTLPDEWLGRSIWETSESSQVNMVFRALVERARAGQAVRVPARCDSPSLLRFVQFSLTAGPDGEVTFSSELTGARFPNSRKQTNRFITVLNPDQVLRVCAWCFRVDSDGWRGIEDIVAEQGLLLDDEVPEITHGICPDCLAAVSAAA